MTEPERKPLVSVERQFETDITTGATQVRMFVKMYFEARDSGLLADIGDRRWRTLCCLATYMDERGVCHPSQARIARDLGIARQRVNERIQELVRYRFQDRPLIHLEKRRIQTRSGERWASNVYQILPIAGLGMFGERRPVSGNPDGGHRPVSGKPDTGKPDTNKNQVMNENTQGVSERSLEAKSADLVEAFHRAMGRDGRLGSKKELSQARALLDRWGPESSRAIIDFAVSEARNTRFEMKHFGAVLSYVPDALSSLSKRAAAKARTEKGRAEERAVRLTETLEQQREADLQKLLAELSAEAVAFMERDARRAVLSRYGGKEPMGFHTLVRIEFLARVRDWHEADDTPTTPAPALRSLA